MASGIIHGDLTRSSIIDSQNGTDITSYTSANSIDAKYKIVTLRFYKNGWGLSIPWILNDNGSGTYILGPSQSLVLDIQYNASTRKFTIVKSSGVTSTFAGWDYFYIYGVY